MKIYARVTLVVAIDDMGDNVHPKKVLKDVLHYSDEISLEGIESAVIHKLVPDEPDEESELQKKWQDADQKELEKLRQV
tara:strand:- start:691 stop:927 length:237 start_codon:yes stop_codon:yes gene_type:complete